MKPNTVIVFCSPAGTTRHVAVVIHGELNRLQAVVLLLAYLWTLTNEWPSV